MEDLIQLDAIESTSERQKLTGYKPPERKEINITPERRQSLIENYQNVVVHNFGDDYHLSMEERVAKNALYAAFHKIRIAKRKYNNIVGYVIQMRNCLECLDKVAEANKLVYPKDKFIKDVLNGKITVLGLDFPKYKGSDRKEINWDYIAKLILDPTRDPKEELVQEESKEVIISNEEEANEKIHEVFTEEEINQIFGDYSEEIQEKMKYPFDPDEDEVYDGLVLDSNKKASKKFVKTVPGAIRAIKTIKKKQRGSDMLHSFTYQLQEDDFRTIEELDRERGFSFENEPPEFKGDILNDDDYKRYLYRLDCWMQENVREEYEGNMRTLEEINMEEIKKGLEAHGWNIRNIYGNKKIEKKAKKEQKEIDKKTERLKARMLKLESRKVKDSSEFTVNSKKKKKKKTKVKGKHRKEAKKTLDDMILNASEVGKKHNSFKEYKKNMEDFRWKS